MKSSSDYDEWETNQGRPYDASFLWDRILKHTDHAIKAQFSLPESRSPDLEALIRLPCLFTYEGRDVTGSIGRISRVTPRARGLELVYNLPTIYPKLRINGDDVFRSLGVGISDNERSRTHWAVKDVDLFEVATTMLHDSGQSTTVLSGHEIQRIWGARHRQGRLVFLSHRASHRQKVSEG